MFLVANLVTTSKALVPSSDALVTTAVPSGGRPMPQGPAQHKSKLKLPIQQLTMAGASKEAFSEIAHVSALEDHSLEGCAVT